jgi:hypothetical protein
LEPEPRRRLVLFFFEPRFLAAGCPAVFFFFRGAFVVSLSPVLLATVRSDSG